MEKRYQIFVSSTYSDLSEEREAIIHSLNRIGYIAVGMEQFLSTGESQMEYIKKVIDDSDYYIVVVRGRYGSTNDVGVSFTELEYDYACQLGIPSLVFLYKDMGNIRLNETDQDPIKLAKLDNFRNKLSSNKIVSFWSNKLELIEKVKDSVHEIVRKRPGIGYVRGNFVMDMNIINERERLLHENKNLRKRAGELKARLDASALENGIPEALHEKISIQYSMRRPSSFEFLGDDVVHDHEYPNFEGTISISYYDCFIIVCDIMEEIIIESDIVFSLIGRITNDITKDIGDYSGYYYNLDKMNLREIRQKLRAKFESLGLIEIAQRSAKDNSFDSHGGRTRVVEWFLKGSGRSLFAKRLLGGLK